ncbi:methionyl-tRNA formyltransferase [Mesonia hippocampi]|uniref:Methionyl-tRNA formyltransferase n=1 Tax=Mesonia hippocampi TaxID=1628250 RepID=A0A840EHQ2_9FLAO|nr:methionyl-tRNA formyltransferase [Mesonia hippocampi]MBB4117949.1 methionyl-tRNA formyltransferase [Mesonia hippocampi]
MKNLRILFMGTPLFAVHILDKIIQAKYNVVGVVTAPDKPAGRGKKLNQSAVKEFALRKNIPVLQPTNLKSEEFQEQLQELQPNLCVVVAFRMLPKKVWSFPKYGTFNLHASLLPDYRGAAPINWAIINGETKTGVTTFFIDEAIDTGNIILQTETPITATDTAGSLHDKLMEQGANLVTKTLQLIEDGTPKTHPQKQENPQKTAYKLTPENTKINWDNNVSTIHNFVRGLAPYPVAYTFLHINEEKLRAKIHAVSPVAEPHNHTPGMLIVENKKIKVYARDGYLLIEEIQLPGKRKMKTTDLLNGFSFPENSYMS